MEDSEETELNSEHNDRKVFVYFFKTSDWDLNPQADTQTYCLFFFFIN